MEEVKITTSRPTSSRLDNNIQDTTSVHSLDSIKDNETDDVDENDQDIDVVGDAAQVVKSEECATNQATDPLFNDSSEEEISENKRGVELSVYYKVCSLYGVPPVTYYLRHHKDSSLNLRHHVLGSVGVKALSIPLQINISITELNLANNDIGVQGLKHVLFMLSENTFIKTIDLSYNNLGFRGAQLIAVSLLSDCRLETIYLTGNKFGDNSAPLFAALIEDAHTVSEWGLAENEFSEAGAAQIGDAIGASDYVRVIDLGWNHIRLKGAAGIALGLKINVGLASIDLCMNGFGSEGAALIASALLENRTLQSINLTNNRIGYEGAVALAKAISSNDVITTLKVGFNPLTFLGCSELIEAACSESSQLTELDLSGITVTNDFIVASEELKLQRPTFKVKVGYIYTGKEPAGKAPGDEFNSRNPLEILLIFMNQQRLRLVDLFKSLDKDQSMSITKAEFIEGLQEVDTPLSKSQMDELIDMLDKDGDGEVDLKEILNINKEFRDIKAKATREAKKTQAASPNTT